MIERQIGNPNPKPLAFEVMKGSKTCMSEEALCRLGVAEDGSERLIQFMGERTGEFAEHRHAGKVGEFRPLFDCFGLGPFCWQ